MIDAGSPDGVTFSEPLVTKQSTRGEGLAGSHGCEVAQDGIGGHGGLPSSEIARIDAGSQRREGRAASSLRRHRLLAREEDLLAAHRSRQRHAERGVAGQLLIRVGTAPIPHPHDAHRRAVCGHHEPITVNGISAAEGQDST
jgi:hypothetical protein